MSPIEIFKALIDNRIRLGLFSYAILNDYKLSQGEKYFIKFI
ncbi:MULTISPECIES: hypothetical protein [unclassified Clostridioides]